MYRLLGILPLAAFVFFSTGCVAPSPLQPRAANNVQRNLDGSTSQGLQVIANYRGRRVFSLEADPVGGAIGLGEDTVRTLNAPWRPAAPTTFSQQSVPTAPMANAASRDACTPAPQAMPSHTYPDGSSVWWNGVEWVR